MSKRKTKQLTANALVGQIGKFVVPMRCETPVKFRVDVRITGVRSGFGRTDLKITPVAGDGQAYVSSKSVKEIKP